MLGVSAAPGAGLASDAGRELNVTERRRLTAAHSLVGVIALYLAALGVLQPPPAVSAFVLSYVSPFMCVPLTRACPHRELRVRRERVGDRASLSIGQGSFSVAPCRTLVFRFATFESLYGGPGAGGARSYHWVGW